MSGPTRYITFNEARSRLRLTEDQLKRMVSKGKIRAIRGEDNSMKFFPKEVERLRIELARPPSPAGDEDEEEVRPI